MDVGVEGQEHQSSCHPLQLDEAGKQIVPMVNSEESHGRLERA
jgi:hypothetical protein